MMKLAIALSLMSCHVFAVTVISERFWCTGDAKCAMEYKPASPSINSGTVTWLLDQWGFQGMPTSIGSSHSFYVSNIEAMNEPHIVKAKLCDMRGNCANFEKQINVESGGFYNEHINLTLNSTTSDVGREPIYAYTDIYYDREHHTSKEANLFLQPFPYDVKK